MQKNSPPVCKRIPRLWIADEDAWTPEPVSHGDVRALGGPEPEKGLYLPNGDWHAVPAPTTTRRLGF